MRGRNSIWKLYSLPQRTIGIKRNCEKCDNDVDHTHCYSCDISLLEDEGAEWHRSHLQAQKEGGSDLLHNIRICCGRCNRAMQTKTPYAYALILKRTEKNSLALHENIQNEEDAKKVYISLYCSIFPGHHALETKTVPVPIVPSEKRNKDDFVFPVRREDTDTQCLAETFERLSVGVANVPLLESSDDDTGIVDLPFSVHKKVEKERRDQDFCCYL